jgi:hypothetical protein
MDISGVDVELLGNPSRDDIDLLIRAARAVWPKCIIEEDRKVYTCRQAIHRHWPIPCEMFIYKTMDTLKSWTESGLTELNANELLSVQVQKDGMFFVVNSKGSAPFSIIEALRTCRVGGRDGRNPRAG